MFPLIVFLFELFTYVTRMDAVTRDYCQRGSGKLSELFHVRELFAATGVGCDIFDFIGLALGKNLL